MNNPILSVIVPVYNVGKFLPACLNSLICQTLSQIEILCIDDDSQDCSAEVVLSYQEQDPRVKLFRQKHSGVSAARNLGIHHARGKYIAFVDSDDWVDPDLYQHMVTVAERTDCDMVVCGAEVHLENPEQCDRDTLADLKSCLAVSSGQWCADDDIGHRWKLLGMPGVWPFIWNKVIRRSCILENSVAFSSALKLGEDGVFVQLLLPYIRSIVFVACPVYHYRCLRKGSAMVRLFQEEDIRFGHHLNVIQILLKEFSRRELIHKHGSYILKWMIRFLYFSFMNLPAENRKKYAVQMHGIFRQYALDQYKRKLDLLKRRRIARMLSVHHDDRFRNLEILVTIAEDKFFQWY